MQLSQYKQLTMKWIECTGWFGSLFVFSNFWHSAHFSWRLHKRYWFSLTFFRNPILRLYTLFLSLEYIILTFIQKTFYNLYHKIALYTCSSLSHRCIIYYITELACSSSIRGRTTTQCQPSLGLILEGLNHNEK